jgi:LysB family phage lysis regulatory protein
MAPRLYLALGVLAAFLALAAYALWQRGEAIDARADQAKAEAALGQAVEANKAHQAAIERLTALNERTDRILADISWKLAGIRDATAETQASVTELERTNEAVRDYLAGVVPADLQRVLNRP